MVQRFMKSIDVYRYAEHLEAQFFGADGGDRDDEWGDDF